MCKKLYNIDKVLKGLFISDPITKTVKDNRAISVLKISNLRLL